MIRRYAPDPARRTELHQQLEARCGLSAGAATLLVELDVFGEVVLASDEHLAALVELEGRGLAERAGAPHACVHAVSTRYVREVMERVRSIMALEGELARRERPREPAPAARGPDEPLSTELERAILDDALAVIARSPTLPEVSKVRVYLRTGPRYARVFWAYRSRGEDDGGSILHFVERATGRIYAAKSARQVGRFTGRVLEAFGGADA